jgi:hypothetical protein
MAAALVTLGVLTRFIGIGDHPPRTDELFHIIAGRSWAEHGTFAMADGEYVRSWPYTVATGILFKLFGAGMAEGRALAAIGGVFGIVAVGLWARKVAGVPAGWVAGLLLCFDYSAIGQAQTARFYTWHALLVWLFAIAVYAFVTGIGRLRWVRLAGLALAAVVSLFMADQLQKMTPVILAAVATWVMLWLLINGKLDPLLRSPVRLTAVAAGLAVVAGVGAALFWQPLYAQWLFFRRAPAWAVEDSASLSYYVQQLAYGYNWMFSLFPVAAMIAWRKHRDAALFLAVVLLVALLAHSLAGMKAMRYVHYLSLFFCALWGVAFAAALPTIRSFAAGIAPGGWATRPRALLAGGLIGFAALLGLVSANYYRDTAVAAVKLIKTGSPDVQYSGRWAREDVDWTPYLPQIRALAKRSVFIATDLQRTVYFLGNYDVMLNKSELDEMGQSEFEWDDRTGRPNISSAASLMRLIRCYPTGSLLVSESKIGSADIPDETLRVIEREMRRVPLPAPLDMRAYEWSHTPDRGSAECRALYDEGYVRNGPETWR